MNSNPYNTGSFHLILPQSSVLIDPSLLFLIEFTNSKFSTKSTNNIRKITKSRR